MLSLQTILDTATPGFLQAWALYEEAFPVEERRTLEQHRALLLEEHYAFCSLHVQEEWVGLMGFWQFPDFTFLEHFAVKEQERGRGIGQQAIQLLLKTTSTPVVLEVEPPHTTVAGKRISFYQKVGFHLNEFPYRQPPYAPDKPWVSLQVMSFPKALDPADFDVIVQKLHRRVYRVSAGS